MAMLFIWLLLYLIAMPETEVVIADSSQLIVLQRSMDSMQEVHLRQQRRLRRYNPNYLTDYEAYLCGFSAAELRKIREFRETGGMLGSWEELSELLGWTRPDAEVRKNSLYFPPKRKSTVSKVARFKVDLNTADGDQLQELSGIGPVLSDRIIRFRTRLNGFRVKEQLYDVYGIRPEVAERLLESHLICSPPDDTSRIQLSTSSPSVLRGFPYLSDRQVDRIMQYRESHNGRMEVDELRVLFDLSKEKFNRIKLYLQ